MKILDLLDENDIQKLRALLTKNPELKDRRPGFAGGGWMHYASRKCDVEILELLIELGFDINDETQDHSGDRVKPIADAAEKARIEIVQFLIESGADLDVDTSVRNALFAAIVGGSVEVVKLLLEAGIECQKRYKSMDAIAFALLREEYEIALEIARFIGKGDRAKIQELLHDAHSRAELNGPVKPIKLVPTMEEFEQMNWDEEGNLI